MPESRQPISVDQVSRYPKRLHPLSIKPSYSGRTKEEISGHNDLNFCERETSFQSDFSGLPLLSAKSIGILFGETEDDAVHNVLSEFRAGSCAEPALSCSLDAINLHFYGTEVTLLNKATLGLMDAIDLCNFVGGFLISEISKRTPSASRK
jgi:hypothetical protein